MVELLLSWGADINSRGTKGETALILASHSSADVAEMLLSQSAYPDPNFLTIGNLSALYFATAKGYTSIVRLLLERNANPNVDSKFATPLIRAAVEGYYDIAELLIQAGVEIDAVSAHEDLLGASPLMVAADYGHIEIVKLLLTNGADSNLANKTGWNALEMARKRGYKDVVLLLQRHEQEDGWAALGRLAARGVHNIKRTVDGFAGEITKPNGQERLLEQATIAAKAEADPQALSLLLSDLNALIGLSSIKSDVAKHINLLRVQQMRREKGLSVPEQSLHMVFSGNPGTGKTSVARLIAEIYKQMGILSKGQFVETDRTGLVAEYLGQTAPKVQAVVKKAIGGVLFIDEAYTLSGNDRGSDQFGQEAVDTLLKLMEDHRNDLIVIVAGYTEPMQRFIESNPGLQSRFNKYLHFEDYSPNDLTSIFTRLAKQHDYELTATAQAKVTAVFQQAYQNRSQTFGNARLSRNLFEKAISEHAMRIGSLPDVTESDLVTIAAEDIQL